MAVAGYSTIRLSVFGGPGTQGKNIWLMLNENSVPYPGDRLDVTLNEGVWTTYEFPLSSFSLPGIKTAIYNIKINNKGQSFTYYIDNIGLN